MLILIRGLPGSGKSTLARQYGEQFGLPVLIYSADDFFTQGGEYEFDPTLLPQAHSWCQEAVRLALTKIETVFVANTFSCRWELEPYLRMVRKSESIVCDLFDRGLTDEALAIQNIHGVPVSTIRAMRERWEHDWQAGDPRPPWERKFAGVVER